MIPFSPWSSSTRWFQYWREFIRKMKQCPVNAHMYAYSAMRAQANYVMHMAIDKVKFYGRAG